MVAALPQASPRPLPQGFLARKVSGLEESGAVRQARVGRWVVSQPCGRPLHQDRHPAATTGAYEPWRSRRQWVPGTWVTPIDNGGIAASLSPGPSPKREGVPATWGLRLIRAGRLVKGGSAVGLFHNPVGDPYTRIYRWLRRYGKPLPRPLPEAGRGAWDMGSPVDRRLSSAVGPRFVVPGRTRLYDDFL
jgi:hypothetical protein